MPLMRASIRLKNILARKIDFLKIDIEGAETEVVEDCAKNLTMVKNVFVEYHSSVGKEQTLPKILSILSGSGMRYSIKEASSSKSPFIDRVTSGFDLQLNISAYR